MVQEQSCTEQLDQLKKEFDEFAYIVSHDFKAPIRAISNLSSWIEEDLGENASEDILENMRLLRNRATRLEHMIEALLRYSRVSRFDLVPTQTDANNLVSKIAAGLPPHVQVNVPTPLPSFYTYSNKLQDVLHHLMVNAATFSNSEQPVITVICTDMNPDYYEFAVSDNGVGVPADVLDKIFNLFYTVSSKDLYDTVGAGLAISKKIVQFVQGSIHAEQNAGHGLKVKFTWPKTINATTTP